MMKWLISLFVQQARLSLYFFKVYLVKVHPYDKDFANVLSSSHRLLAQVRKRSVFHKIL